MAARPGAKGGLLGLGGPRAGDIELASISADVSGGSNGPGSPNSPGSPGSPQSRGPKPLAQGPIKLQAKTTTAKPTKPLGTPGASSGTKAPAARGVSAGASPPSPKLSSMPSSAGAASLLPGRVSPNIASAAGTTAATSPAGKGRSADRSTDALSMASKTASDASISGSAATQEDASALQPTHHDRSFFIFGTDNRIRLKMKELTGHSAVSDKNAGDWTPAHILTWLDYLLTVAMLAILIAFPVGMSPDIYMDNMKHYMLLAVFLFFTLEIVFASIANGFLFSKEAFLRASHANRFDFIVVVVFWVDFFLWLAGVSYIQLFAAIYALRALKLFNAYNGTKRIVSALFETMPLLINVFFFLFFFMLLFSIIGVRAFQGSLQRRCVIGDFDVFPPLLPPPFETVAKGYACPEGQTCQAIGNPEGGMMSFDNFLNAFLNVFTILTMSGWNELMYSLEESEFAWIVPIYFVVVVAVLAFVMAPLLLAVISEVHSRSVRDLKQGTAAERKSKVLEDSGDNNGWVLKDRKDAGQEEVFKKIYDVFDSTAYEVVIMLLVAINVGVQATRTASDSPAKTRFLDMAELVFTILFAAIAVAQLSIGPYLRQRRRYFFDLFLAVVTSIIQIPAIRNSDVYPYLTAFQLMRVHRIIFGIPPIRDLVQKAFRSTLAILNVLVLMIGSLFIFTTVGMQLFGGQYDAVVVIDQLDSEENPPWSTFDNFGMSFLSLFRVMTGDDWEIVMYSTMQAQFTRPATAQAYNIVTVAVAGLFFCAMYIVTNYILLNIFIAAILENFDLDEDEKIRKQWKEFKGKQQSADKTTSSTKMARIVQKLTKTKDALVAKIKSDSADKPVKLATLPRNLVAKVKAADIEHALNDSSTTDELTPSANSPSTISDPADDAQRTGWWGRLRARLTSGSVPLSSATTTGFPFPTATLRPSTDPTNAKAMNGSNPEEDREQAVGVYFPAGPRELVGLKYNPHSTLFAEEHVLPYFESSLAALEHFLQVRSAGIDASAQLPSDAAGSPPPASSMSSSSVRPGLSGGAGVNQQDYLEKLPPRPPFDRSFGWMERSHPIRQFCRWILSSDITEQREKAREQQAGRYKSMATAQVEGLVMDGTKRKTTIRRPPFDWFILAAIVASTVLLALDTPAFQREQEELARLFVISDYVFAVIFFLEFVLRVIADGIWLTPRAYFRSPWNWFDFLILGAQVIDVVYFRGSSQTQGISRFFRAVRALRPLRIINQFDGVKEIFQIIFMGWKRLLQALAVMLLLFVPFAIWGVNLYNGQMMSCNDDDVSTEAECVGTFKVSVGVVDDVVTPRVWANPFNFDFDNVFAALVCMFEMSSTEGWTKVFVVARDIRGPGIQPQQDANLWASVYFVPFMLVGWVFVVQLFIAIVVGNFKERKMMSLATLEQSRWRDLQRQLRMLAPSKAPPAPENNPRRRKVYDIVMNKRGKFAKFIIGVMLAHTVVICIDFYQQRAVAPYLWLVQQSLSLLFLTVYLTELLLKLYALGPKGFLKIKWNWYDTVVVIGAFALNLWLIPNSANPNYLLSQLEKVLVLLIVFRLVQKVDKLQTLFKTIWSAAFEVYNITVFALLVFVAYSIMAVQLFGLTRYLYETNEHANFRDFGRAILIFFRTITGEDWNYLMHDLAIEPPYCVRDDSDFLNSDCGSPSWSYFLFLTFYTFGTFLTLNMFIVVILDNFSYWYQQDESNSVQLTRDDFRGLKEVWRKFDPKSTGEIRIEDLPRFMGRLSGVFQVKIYDEPAWETMKRQDWADDFRAICRLYYKPQYTAVDGRTQVHDFKPTRRAAATEASDGRDASAGNAHHKQHRFRFRLKLPADLKEETRRRWTLLHERYILPRLIAFMLRRTFRLRDPHRNRRIDAVFMDGFENRRQKQEAELEKKRKEVVRQRRLDLNLFYLENLMNAKESDAASKHRVVKFSDMIMALSFRLIDFETALSFAESEQRGQLRERMIDFVAMERVTGFAYNWRLHREFSAMREKLGKAGNDQGLLPVIARARPTGFRGPVERVQTRHDGPFVTGFSRAQAGLAGAVTKNPLIGRQSSSTDPSDDRSADRRGVGQAESNAEQTNQRMATLLTWQESFVNRLT